MRNLFRSKTRVVTLVSLAFLTQCCCIVVPLSAEAQRQFQERAAQQQNVAQQAAVERTVVQQIVDRIESAVTFTR